MLVDVQKIVAGSTVRTTIAIIGAGAAGISLARRLARHGLEVALLEAGGFQFDPESHVNYVGNHQTNAFEEAYAIPYVWNSRQRYFGGSTNCWAGWCVPLDPWDFKKRPWLEHSGWPLDFDDLAAYYDQASAELEVKPFNRETFDQWFEHLKGKLILDTAQVKTRVLHRAQEVPRFNTLRREEILTSDKISLYLNSTVFNIECNGGKTGVQRLKVLTPDKKAYYLEADHFVLATGGLENPRTLLSCTDDFPEGLGNQHDQVGRYFMEHLEMRYIAELFMVDPEPSFGLYMRLPVKQQKEIVYACFSLSEKALAEHGLYNCSFYLNFSDSKLHRTEDPFKNALWHVTSRVEHLDDPAGHPEISSYLGSLTCRSEHAPHPENRVTLQPNRLDSFGKPQLQLSWKAQPRDYENIHRSLEILAREFGAAGKGRLKLTLDPEAPKNPCYGGPHHMGTTRMHEDPKQGVVDAHCKVHGLDNLHIAGSSVFPTGGFANPTLTLVALALRLGDHLAAEVGAPA